MTTDLGDYGSLPVEEALRAARTGLRRRQVLDAAVKVMGKTGFHQMSMQDLAAEANVSVGLIYKYFGGKEDLLLATIMRIQDAVVLTYRESRTLDGAGRAQIKELEIATAAPLRVAIQAGVAAGKFRDVDVDLTVFDVMLLAHGWALKRWHFGPIYTLDEYIRLQTRHLLDSLIPPSSRADYANLLD